MERNLDIFLVFPVRLISWRQKLFKFSLLEICPELLTSSKCALLMYTSQSKLHLLCSIGSIDWSVGRTNDKQKLVCVCFVFVIQRQSVCVTRRTAADASFSLFLFAVAQFILSSLFTFIHTNISLIRSLSWEIQKRTNSSFEQNKSKNKINRNWTKPNQT